jgi:hypothetical protein
MTLVQRMEKKSPTRTGEFDVQLRIKKSVGAPNPILGVVDHAETWMNHYFT